MIDLFSDTQTRPTPAMRQAIANAEVGDEQSFLDPTINRLREVVCDLLGKEDAVFMPSGTMCNEIALAVHCRPGEEVLTHETSHIINFEGGGPSALAGVMVRALTGDAGRFDVPTMKAALRPDSRYFPRSRLVSVEQTANLAGGRIWPVEQLHAIAQAAHTAGLATHMDGARLMNAVVASGRRARDHVAGFDSVWLDFSKGLGCPMGAMLTGSRAFIEEAWRHKQRWGGALRQAGIVGAAALYSLEHHVDRLAEDHANARLLATGLAELPGVTLDPATVETNIVFFDVAGTGRTAQDIVADLLAAGARMGAMSPTVIRAVTHLDVDRNGIFKTLELMRTLLR